MTCVWEPLFRIFPDRLKSLLEPPGKEQLREIRLRRGYPVELNYGSHHAFSQQIVSQRDLDFLVSGASRYSPWRTSTVAEGYLTVEGGHRIGLCGQAVIQGGCVTGLREVDSLCIRIARDIPGIAAAYGSFKGSVLIIGAPGRGKTTMLRDLSRNIAGKHTTVVVDERCELFPEGFHRGKRMDVLSLCPKAQGIEMALRTMGPEVIAVDEITAEADCEALLRAANCGVRLLATAHARSVEDLESRQIYRRLLEMDVFDDVITLEETQAGKPERMAICKSDGLGHCW